MKKFFLLPLIFTFFIGQTQNPLLSEDYSKQNRWVDSIYNNLDLEEKIGQLITVWVATQYGEDEIKHISKLIEDYKLGGLIFSLGDIKSQAKAINKFQKQSKVPLLISMDAEWGIGMRLDDGFSFPYNMTLGAIENDSLKLVPNERQKSDSILVENTLFEQQIAEAHFLFAKGMVADHTGDTLETIFNFKLLFESLAQVDEMNEMDEFEKITYNRT